VVPIVQEARWVQEPSVTVVQQAEWVQEPSVTVVRGRVGPRAFSNSCTGD
jgi:hypothetical protein